MTLIYNMQHYIMVDNYIPLCHNILSIVTRPYLLGWKGLGMRLALYSGTVYIGFTILIYRLMPGFTILTYRLIPGSHAVTTVETMYGNENRTGHQSIFLTL